MMIFLTLNLISKTMSITKSKSKTAYLVETFISLEGEGPYTGYPTVYARLGGCNLRCKGFNNPDMLDVLDFNPKDYNNLKELPPITRGCDSNYAVDSAKFSHLWKKVTALELINEILELLPNKHWKSVNTGLPYILSITGGEPTIHQDFLIEFCHLLLNTSCNFPQIIIIETNATIELKEEFWNVLSDLALRNTHIVWSNSLKLSNSGEDLSNTIKPQVLLDQSNIGGSREQYFKFVVDGSDAILHEIEKIIEDNHLHAIINHSNIYLMPAACNNKQLVETGRIVAEQCIKYGYKFCNRLQNVLWDNEIAT